jgi:hypothetical protein
MKPGPIFVSFFLAMSMNSGLSLRGAGLSDVDLPGGANNPLPDRGASVIDPLSQCASTASSPQ